MYMCYLIYVSQIFVGAQFDSSDDRDTDTHTYVHACMWDTDTHTYVHACMWDTDTHTYEHCIHACVTSERSKIVTAVVNACIHIYIHT